MATNGSEDGLRAVSLRYEFYRDNYRRVVMALLIAVVVILGLVVMLGIQMANKPQPTYFATYSDGRLVPLVPLDRPNLSQRTVLQWTQNAVLAVYSYDWVNYRKNLQDASKYFTQSGWTEFLKTLQSSNILSTVKAQNLNVSAIVSGPAVVLAKGVYPSGLLKNRYAWKIQMKIKVTYQSASEIKSQNLTVQMLVVRVPTLESTEGIGIQEMVATTTTGAQ